MNTTTEKPVEKALADLGFALTSTGPTPKVREDWPCIAYSVTLTLNGREILTTDYHLGIGHVKNPKPGNTAGLHLSTDEQAALVTYSIRPGAQLKDRKLAASLASKLAVAQKVKPGLAGVLHSLVSDGEAHFNSSSFEDWAADFGYDADSRKAEKTFNECVETGRKLARGIPAKTLETVRELLQDY